MQPVISAVICTYNRDRYIRKALESLAMQNMPADQYEVLIIDNNSTDNTAAICKRFIHEHGHLHIRYFFEEKKGLSFARNRGIAEAASGIITFIDDDAEAAPGFLKTIADFIKNHPEAVGIGGKVTPVYTETGEPPWMNRYLDGFAGKVNYGDAIKLYRPPMKYPAGCNMTYTREILEKAGGFNNQLTFRSDDKHIFYQVKKLSDKIYYVPAAAVNHHIDAERLSFCSFKKLFLKTGNEEKRRVKSEQGFIGLVKKFIELKLKFGAALLLYFKFLLASHEIKGRYIVFSQWFTLVGFLKKEVFVR